MIYINTFEHPLTTKFISTIEVDFSIFEWPSKLTITGPHPCYKDRNVILLLKNQFRTLVTHYEDSMVLCKSNPKETTEFIPIVNTCNHYLVFVMNKISSLTDLGECATSIHFIVVSELPEHNKPLQFVPRSWYRMLLTNINKPWIENSYLHKMDITRWLIVDLMMVLKPPLCLINNLTESELNFIYPTLIISSIKQLNKTLVTETRSCQLHRFS